MKPPIKNFSAKNYPQGNVINWFGDDVELYKASLGTPGHTGIDIVGPYGTSILCVESGEVTLVNENTQNGKMIGITTERGFWMYAHLSRIEVTEGQKVTEGQIIGRMGNSGFQVIGATPYWEYNPYAGTHLHLAFAPKDGTGKPEMLGYVDFREELEDCDPGMVVYKNQLKLTIQSLKNQLAVLMQKVAEKIQK